MLRFHRPARLEGTLQGDRSLARSKESEMNEERVPLAESTMPARETDTEASNYGVESHRCEAERPGKESPDSICAVQLHVTLSSS